MPLNYLNCSRTKVTDLAPLATMRHLERLECEDIPVASLAPLKGLPLKMLRFDFRPERGDAAVLRSIKTLERIKDKPADEFWKDVDSRKPPAKP
jgi:hypothetical protein